MTRRLTTARISLYMVPVMLVIGGVYGLGKWMGVWG